MIGGRAFGYALTTEAEERGWLAVHSPGHRWLFPGIMVTLPSRGCVARQEPYIPGALSIL